MRNKTQKIKNLGSSDRFFLFLKLLSKKKLNIFHILKMKNQQENLDQIIRKNFPKDIAFKRVQKGIFLHFLNPLNFV